MSQNKNLLLSAVVMACLLLFVNAHDAKAVERCTTTANVTIPGNQPRWFKVGTVSTNQTVRVLASGRVNFGGPRQNDGPEAGVTGLLEALRQIYKLVTKVNRFASCIKGNFISCARLFWDFAKRDNPVKYDQGGVWIKVVETPRNLAQAVRAKKAMETNLYFYWLKIWNKLGGIKFTKNVTIYAMAHDGGKSSTNFKRADYKDNKGSYKVQLKLCTGSTRYFTMR